MAEAMVAKAAMEHTAAAVAVAAAAMVDMGPTGDKAVTVVKVAMEDKVAVEEVQVVAMEDKVDMEVVETTAATAGTTAIEAPESRHAQTRMCWRKRPTCIVASNTAKKRRVLK